MRTLWQDVRYGCRMLGRNPGFTAVVVVILAVAIGANTAIFSVVNAVMLRPLPYKDSHRLVTIWEQGIRTEDAFRARPHFLFLRENNQVFESLAGYCGCWFHVAGIERPHETRGCEVTANLFPLLGVPPLLGRGFLPEEEKPESPRVVMVSHAFWRDYLGGSPDVIGKSISLTSGRMWNKTEALRNYESYTIVGVMPPGFTFPFWRSVPLWRPLILAESANGRGAIPVVPLARLKKGVTREQVSADLTLLADRLRQIDPEIKVQGAKYYIRRLLDEVVQGHRKLPLLLLGAAGFVLLIACANVANLFLARATVRQREIVMRLALGASRARVMRQMLTESLLLSLGAGVLGLALTFGTVKGLVRLCPSDIPRLQETSVDLSVLGFTLGASLFTGLLFGMMPAWRASDLGVSETLKESSGRTTSGRGWRRLHSGLVVSQLGLSLILLIGAALLIRSLIALESIDLGYRPESVLAVSIGLPPLEYAESARRNAFFQPLLERLPTLPYLRLAALFSAEDVADVLGSTNPHGFNFAIAGRPDSEPSPSARWVRVTPDFFETMGIRFLRGRTLTDREPDTVVIDETLAQECFPGVDPIGQRLITDERREHTIVGVVDTVRSFGAPDPTMGMVYARQDEFPDSAVLLVRTDGDPTRLAPALRAQVADLEKDEVIKTLESLDTTLSRMLAPRRFTMILLSLFAGIALIVASVGIYGLLQYSTTQQTHDIGIRIALGARKLDVLRAILARGFKLTVIGIVIGLAGAVALTRVLASLLYDVTPTDPLTLACVSLVLAAIALLASYVPARRAARIDPMAALRYE